MALFQPAKIGDIEVKNRFIMAPLTRCRATPRTHVPTPIMVEYYEQRATAGLIIAEATMVGDGQSAFWAEPGIYNEAQVEGWKPVTEAVHAKGGKIILQIWHGGRACHHLNGPNEDPAQNPQPVAPSAVAVAGHQIGAEFNPTGAKVDYDTPRALTEEEIPSIIAAYVRGAQNAIAAGFDGVEIHGANGYLIDEFLRDSANQRPDGRYSGKSVETRAQFALDVAAAVAAAIGAGKVGIRISPINSYNGMIDSNPEALTRYLCAKLSELNLAFLHVMRSDFFKAQQGDAQGWARESYKGFLIANMGYKADEANETIEAGKTDAIAFGVSFIANPDLVERVQKGAPLNPPDFATFYQGGVKGYTDYPMLQALA